jgi:hypothetical protein
MAVLSVRNWTGLSFWLHAYGPNQVNEGRAKRDDEPSE